MGSPLDAGRRIAALIGKADDAPGVIRAYHGSPHSFSRFDASKIGTGEGAQSFGHGLYFAGEENVARQYRNMLGGRRDVFIGDESAIGLNQTLREGPAFSMPRTPQGDAVRALMAGAYGVDSVDEVLINARRYASDNTPEMAVAVNAALDELAARGLRLGPQPGHMYEVEIGYPEDALLDLDLPVQSQPQLIQDALGKYAEAPPWFSLGQEGWVGKNAYTRMAGDMAAASPRIVGGYHVTHDQPAASAALLQAGVPGIRYFDGGSRSAGDGTRNYVMFPGTEDRISILRQYGLLPPLVGAGMMEEE